MQSLKETARSYALVLVSADFALCGPFPECMLGFVNGWIVEAMLSGAVLVTERRLGLAMGRLGFVDGVH